jgi:hypothetical protein
MIYNNNNIYTIIIIMRIIELCNHAHLGDNIFVMIMFYHIKQYIEENDIHIHYYILDEYIGQVKDFICSPNIRIFPFKDCSMNLWIRNFFDVLNFLLIRNNPCCFDVFYIHYYNYILNHLKIPRTITQFEYFDYDLVRRYELLDERYKNIDILINNSFACSGQFKINDDEWNHFIGVLHSKYKIVTTRKVDDIIPCTTDTGSSVKDIASMSTHAKIIIAVNNGVVPGLLNTITMNNVKKVYIFDCNNKYSFSKFENKNSILDISLDEIEKFIFSLI